MTIIIENLTKKYKHQKAVDNISFQIPTGQVVGFLGPNGAGKSTTMKIVTCYISPNEGNVRLDDFNIREHSQQIKKRIGYLPENNPLYGKTTKQYIFSNRGSADTITAYLKDKLKDNTLLYEDIHV